MNLLLGVSGSVAAIKIVEIVHALNSKYSDMNITILATNNALHFLDLEALQQVSNVKFYSDRDEWQSWRSIGDTILHIELRNWADVLLIAPLSANTLAKLANGLCDNLLTSVVRAWNLSKPILIAPAMNTAMWENPLTEIHLSVLTASYPLTTIIPPMEKHLACGDFGTGALASVETILAHIGAIKGNTLADNVTLIGQ